MWVLELADGRKLPVLEGRSISIGRQSSKGNHIYRLDAV